MLNCVAVNWRLKRRRRPKSWVGSVLNGKLLSKTALDSARVYAMSLLLVLPPPSHHRYKDKRVVLDACSFMVILCTVRVL